MAWEHLSITKPHLVYIILGGFTSLFMLCSSVIKERMYIGEATVATICGLIFGPHAANLIDPKSWGNVDIVTIEFSRIVLVVQCFAIGVELPKFYMEKHWKSVIFLLVPVMTFGWLITSLIVWWMVPPLAWLDSLVIAACVTATDPVLASSVVGKGKFAKRVPKHLRDLLSAESGCNDGMAFPFVYLSLYLIQDHLDAKKVTFHFIVYTILYECVFGAIYGFLIGYLARHGIKYAEKHDLIDRESFLVFYFTLALFCAGSGSILGVDDLLVGFSAGVGFSNDGWFGQKTEESHVSNVIDLLINLAYFVFLGTIIPWEMFNNADIGLSAWRLTIIAIFVILFRRIPVMMALKPLIPDTKTWREALFAGHFGPIGVGAVFIAILARAELESGDPVPLAELPAPDVPHYTLITLVWPVTVFLVVASILVHGSSIAVFTLGKHINTLTLTMSYTTAPEDGPSWMNRLPRISSQSRSQARSMSDTDVDEAKLPEVPPGTLPPIGYPGNFLRRVRDEDKDKDGAGRQGSRASSLAGRRRRKKWDDGIGPGGPISQSAIFPQRRSQSELAQMAAREDSFDQALRERSPGAQSGSGLSEKETEKPQPTELTEPTEPTEPTGRNETEAGGHGPAEGRRRVLPEVEVYDEGDHIIVETRDGDVIAVEPGLGGSDAEALKNKIKSEASSTGGWTYESIKKRLGNWRDEEIQKRKEKEIGARRHEPARAYQFGNTIIVEDEDGEVVKKYDLPAQKSDRDGGDLVAQGLKGLKYMGMASLVKGNTGERSAEAGPSSDAAEAAVATGQLTGKTGESQRPRKKSVVEAAQEEDDKHIRFTIGGVGQRMTKGDFIMEMQRLDKSTRREVVDQSSASHMVKALAKQDGRGATAGASGTKTPSGPPRSDEKEGHREGRTTTRKAQQAQNAQHAQQAWTPAQRPPQQLPQQLKADWTVGAAGDIVADGETAAERRRRMAVLSGMASGDEGDECDEGDEASETPAERRRREAALGIRENDEARDEDSDDDDTPRVPPTRRGIRFADVPDKG